MKLRVPVQSVHRGSYLCVPVGWVDKARLEKELTLTNGAFWTAVQSGQPTEGIPTHIIAFKKRNGIYYVPRHYKIPLNKKGRLRFKKQGNKPYKLRRQIAPIYINHNIKLRNKIQENASLSLQNTRDDKILTLACGVGKSVVSLHAASELSHFPLLIVVHTNAIRDHWFSEIQNFLSQDGSPVEVGHIQGNIIKWKNYPIAIAMVQTLVKKNFSSEFYRYWKQVIFDEGHRLGAEHFSKAAPLFLGERWCLTATLEREDKMDRLIKLHTGDVSYSYLEQPLKAAVYFVSTGVRVSDKSYFFRRGKVNFSKMLTDLAENEERNKLVQYWLDKAISQKRTILILGERLTQLNYLIDGCSSSSKALHVGSMSKKERQEALTKQVVFATQHLAKEGLNRPKFDTLFILFPFGGKGRLRQSIGRILRILEGKKKPKVVVFYDEQSRMMSHIASKMRRHANALQFKTVILRGNK